MNKILDEILGHLRLIKNDQGKLQKIFDFISAEIVEEVDSEPE